MTIDFVYEDDMTLSEKNYEKQFLKIVQTTLESLEIEEDVELSCLLVNDHRIQEINREYRHKDMVTDVISFALEDTQQFYIEGLSRQLGDIFISYPRACLQAKDYQHTIEREMCFLFLHGLLHLLGYDHQCDDDEKAMLAIQKTILKKLGIERG